MKKPPVAPEKETQLSYHGQKTVDSYFWLKNIQDPDTLKYIKAESKYTSEVLAPLRPLEGKLFKELKATINENDMSVPVPIGSWLYFSRVKKGLQYSIYYRKPRSGGREQLLLDCNQLAQGKKYFALGAWAVSPDQNWLAYGTDCSGNETYTIYFKNLKTGQVLREKIEKAAGDIVWCEDNRTVYYTELDENHRPHRVLRRRLGDKSAAQVVFSEQDQKHFVGLHKSSDEKWILISTAGQVTSEVWFASSLDPETSFECVEPRKEGREYTVDSRDGLFYIRTNEGAVNFRLMVTSVYQPGFKNWIEFISEDPEGLLRRFLLFQNFLVLFKFKRALPEVVIYDFAKEKYSQVAFKEKAFALSLDSGNEEFDSPYLRMTIQSPVLPETTIDYDMRNGKRKVLKQTKVKGYRSADYKCERLMVPSHDGKEIPLTIFYKKGFKKNGKAPVLLYGYGSYGSVMQPNFRRTALPLLKRGFAYAIAHIRGGQELGRQWYEDGKYLKKKNTFHDFISVSDWLIQKRWTTPQKLAIMGGSAGGMLMGAVINMRPELYQVCVAHVPFVDVINTMFDDSLPLTKIEYKEWGDPHDKKFYEYMKSYSPYDNVKSKRYPNLLITGGLHDFRVTYWEPTKWAAKLRKLKTGNETLLLKIKTSAGHFGASGRFDYLKEEAEALAFIIRYLDLPLR
jgi:oligopeptidase B